MHIGVTGILFGGHVFAVSEDILRPWLYLTILTGAFLLTIEAYPSCRWFYQGRGILLLTKLLLLCGTLLLWPYRVWLLASVVVLASVGSHMPARFRYYSIVHRRVLND